MNIDKEGWCSAASYLISPNQDDRPDQQGIDLLVIHNISLPPGEFGGNFICDFFLHQLDCDAHPFFNQLRSLKVSSHFLIRRDGTLVQFVSTNKRAWHAGVSSYQGRERCNNFSIGIEIEGTDYDPFMPEQYDTLTALTLAICQRYPIKGITGHQHIAPDRKTDPGPFFDWSQYQKRLQAKNLFTSRYLPLEFFIK